MEGGVECEAKKDDNELEVKQKKEEIKGTKFVYVKNCTNNEIEIPDVNGNKTKVPSGTYHKFQPSKPEMYECVYWKKTTGNVKK